jgi:hypothetical protein
MFGGPMHPVCARCKGRLRDLTIKKWAMRGFMECGFRE